MGQIAQCMLETHLVSLYQMSPPGCTHVCVADYNEVNQLYEAACLKLDGEALPRAHIFQRGGRASCEAGHRQLLLKRPRSLVARTQRRQN
ncbi:hypothetical protein JCGZ_01923 [Jatropha curcas]|uniref:Uncharacterized protein n=1 Tax=Jatropha curcas TaxID=180498 RepID=A0A067JG82_JATCU|nr:hypothetical protein JCGZ_01923 [Jatropha curcas]